MFKSVLIANRGEIACRIIKTCDRLNIQTIAVFSDADYEAKHTQLADLAIRIGPSNPAESYLNIDTIIAAAKKSGAEAIHPGYGFLSENPDFAQTVENNGIKFIGPDPEMIRLMGLKDQAKRIAQNAGVPVLQGYKAKNISKEKLLEEANRIGYPILLKAVAGGGGKGIRRINNETEFFAGFDQASKEAQLAFGNTEMMIEKFITRPRHIEVQVFGDNFGNRIHLFERDCSIQRKNQKLIEEAPAPNITTQVKEFLYEAALKLANAIDYKGAGTVEFIADASDEINVDKIWFLEMNTRLQVEHTVTEQITGLDLVEWQLRVANNEPLPLSQERVQIQGHSIEARICSEAVLVGYLPSIGKVNKVMLAENLRVENSIETWNSITPFYDSLLAKLIATGTTREQAIKELSKGMRQSEFGGIKTNLNLLVGIIDTPEFIHGDINTGFLDDYLPFPQQSEPPPNSVLILAAAAVVDFYLLQRRNWKTGFSHWHCHRQTIALNRSNIQYDLEVSFFNSNTFKLRFADAISKCQLTPRGIFIGLENVSHKVYVHNSQVSVYETGLWEFSFAREEFDHLDESRTSNLIISQVPGLLKLVNCKEGKTVSKGEILAYVEAMKMEFTLAAPSDCVIEKVFATNNSLIKAGEKIAQLSANN